MTDLEITTLCAKAMGIRLDADMLADGVIGYWDEEGSGRGYSPLHDDAQAMALIRRLQLCIQPPEAIGVMAWHVWKFHKPNHTAVSDDLNRAICECVAKAQNAKVAR